MIKYILTGGKQFLEKAFPEKRREIAVLLGIVPILWLASLFTDSGKAFEVLNRPKYSEKKTSIALSYDYQGENAFSDNITIVLEKQEPTRQEVEAKIASAKEQLEKMINKGLRSPIRQKLSLPKKWQDLEISYQISPEDILTEEGNWNYNGAFKKRTEIPLKIKVDILYHSDSMEISDGLVIEQMLSKADFDSAYIKNLLKMELEAEMKILSGQRGEEFSLPKEFAGEKIYWFSLKSRVSPINMLLIFLILLLITSTLSRMAAREKQQNKEKRYRRELSNFVHQMVLLLRCGKSPYGALIMLCQSEGGFSGEFRQVLERCYRKIYHQESFAEAVKEFSLECDLPETETFQKLLLMAYERGDEWSVHYMEQLRDDMFAERLRKANEFAQKATTRLMFPMILFLVVIIIMTIFPAFEMGV